MSSVVVVVVSVLVVYRLRVVHTCDVCLVNYPMVYLWYD